MKKSRVWQAIVPGTQTKPQDTLRIRKTPWHGVTKQPPAVPLPPNATPERNEKIKVLAGNCSRHTNKPQDTLQIRKTPWHGVTKQPPAVPLPGPNVTPEPNEKSRVWQAIVPGTQNKPQDTLQIRKTPWHGVTKQPPSLCPGQRVWQAIVPGTQNKPQDTLQIRETSCGLFCVPGTIACQTLDFSFGSGVTFGPGRGTAGGCFVTPCQGVFLI